MSRRSEMDYFSMLLDVKICQLGVGVSQFENGHNWGLEITLDIFRPLVRQEISSQRVSTCREGLKQLFCSSVFKKSEVIKILG